MRIVVLGGGSTGEHFVGALRRLDDAAELTLVERRAVGGECSYWGCMPTKTMLRGPELAAAAGRSWGAVTATLEPARVFAWREQVVDGRDDSAQATWLAGQRCELVRGDAVVAEPGLVRVGGRELPYDKLVIATGSSPRVPAAVHGIDYWTNHEATETNEVPESLLVLGGGPAGCELAQFFARAGARVTLVQRNDRLLPKVDADAAALVQAALEADGVEVRLGAAVDRAELARHARVLVATGRTPNVAGLEPLALSIGAKGIQVDERLRAAENVWAIGDVNGIALFTHVGKYHARVAAYDIAGRDARADHRAIPAVIFTDPQVATVGSLAGTVSKWPLTSVPRLSTYERPKRDGFVKIAADPERRVIVGAVAVGPDTGEWLQQLTLAIRAEVPIDVLLDTIPPYPTFAEGVFLALRELDFDL